MKAIRLKTAYLINPIGIDLKHPLLSWNCQNGEKQTAYQLTAKNERGNLVFDTGKIESGSMHVSYAGEELTSGEIVTWQVKVWDEKGTDSLSETASFEMGLLDPQDWQAKWIAGADTAKEAHLPADYFRKKFPVNNKVKKARLYASAHGVYEAKINGRLVSSFLAPGTTEYEKRLYYQTYDVTDCLLPGENELALVLGDGWYKGKVGSDQNEYLFGNQTSVFGQLVITYEDGSKDVIATDGDFEWSNDGPIRFSDLKDGEIYDARMKPSYSSRARVLELYEIPTASDSVPVTCHETFTPELLISPSGASILDFKQNMAGYVSFRVKAAAGTRIVIKMFEALDHGEYSNTSLSFSAGNVASVKQEIDFTCSGYEDEFRTNFFYSGFQYALVEGLDKVNPEDFTAVSVYSNLEFGGKFTCSNDFINKFLSNTIWSMKSNFVDVPTDCPQREKSGWTGDAQVFCRTANYLADTRAFYRKWLRDVRDCQRENGLVVDVNPRCNPIGTQRDMVNGSAGWADAAIIIPYTLWKQTGDEDFITNNLELMLGWMNYVMSACRDKGIYHISEGSPLYPMKPLFDACLLPDSPWNQYIPESGIHWGEWCVPQSQEPGNPNPVAALLSPKQEVTTAYLHYSMTMLEEMLQTIGDTDHAELCRQYADGSNAAYHTHWIKEGTAATNHMAELVRPIALGLANEEEKKTIAGLLNDMAIARNYKVGTGFLSTPFLLQTLAENGYLHTAYRMLENREAPGWLAMVAGGATSVWEEYECYGPDGSPLEHSFNHYSPGAVCAFLFDTVCGIKVAGENLFTITPNPGGTLSFASAETLTAYGIVKSSWEKKDGKITYTFEIPSNTRAYVKLPDGREDNLTSGLYTM